jgi:hypothetical protein
MSYLLSRLLGSRARLAVVALGLLLPIGFGIVWFMVGGLPRDHDEYATVPLGETRTVELPGDEVRVYFQGEAGEDGKTEPQPAGLATRIVPVGGGDPLPLEDVSSSLFGGSSGDIRWQPLAKADVAAAGEFRLSAEADADASTSTSAAITVGKAPWNPLGSRLVGAFLVFFLFAALFAGIGLLASAGWRILEEERRGKA